MDFLPMLSSSQPPRHTPSERKTGAGPSLGGNSSSSEKHMINGSNCYIVALNAFITKIERNVDDLFHVIGGSSSSGSSTSAVSTLFSTGERTNEYQNNEEPSYFWMCFSMPFLKEDEDYASRRQINDGEQHEINKNREKHSSTFNVDNEEVEAEVESTLKEPTEISFKKKKITDDDLNSLVDDVADQSISFLTMEPLELEPSEEEAELNAMFRVLCGGSYEMMDAIDDFDENADEDAKEKSLLKLTHGADANRDNPNFVCSHATEYLQSFSSAAEIQNIVVAEAGQIPRVSPVRIVSLVDVEEDNDDSSTDENALSETFFEMEQEKMEHQMRFLNVSSCRENNDDSSTDDSSTDDSSTDENVSSETFYEMEKEKVEHHLRSINISYSSWDELSEFPRNYQRLVDKDDGSYMSSPDQKSTSVDRSTEDSNDETTGPCSQTKTEEEANNTSVKLTDSSNRSKDLMTQVEKVIDVFDEIITVLSQLETNDNSKSRTTTASTTNLINKKGTMGTILAT